MKPRGGWKAWEPETGSDAFYIGQDLAMPGQDRTVEAPPPAPEKPKIVMHKEGSFEKL